MTKATESKVWATTKRVVFHFFSCFLVLTFLGVCLALFTIVGGSAWKIWESVAAAVGSTRPGRFFAFLFLMLITAGCFATFGGLLCFSLVKGFLRKSTSLSSKQKESIEGNATMAGALIPAGFYIFICLKGWIEGKI